MAQREKEGAFFKVPLYDKIHTYGRIVAGNYYAFYDAKTDKELTFEEIVSKPILFIVAMYRSAITKEYWKIIGVLPLEDKLKVKPTFFMQDILNPKRLTITNDGGATQKPATLEDCLGLEKLAVWTPQSIEDRLRDHYEDKPFRFTNMLIEIPKK